MIFNDLSEHIQPLLIKIYHHPFNLELADGSLAQEKFIGYLVQDALYLQDFSKALSIIGSRLPSQLMKPWLPLATGAIEAEQQLHQKYLQNNLVIIQNTIKNPACFMYTNYLLSTATLASVEEAVASVLPCFWIYQKVGEFISQHAQKPNPYQAWISMYASEDFERAVNFVIEVTNHMALHASDGLQQRMIQAFERASELEWLFWNDAYHQQTWMGALE